MADESTALLRVHNLKTHFFTDAGIVTAVDGISFHIDVGEILGIVGESGCGKSVTALSVMGLVPSPPGKIVDGRIMFDGKDLRSLEEEGMLHIRGRQISMIFQDPATSLDPSYTVGYQLLETIRRHRKMSKKEAVEQAESIMTRLNIPKPKDVAACYPHQLSGGMIQRVMIAMALLCEPRLLIADEPTTALDATVQFQILSLINQIREQYNTSVMTITHDFGVVAMLCDRVAVMYAGNIVESSDTQTILERPSHPYTQALIHSVPRLGKKVERLYQIDGQPPDLINLPPGCRFVQRCPESIDLCRKNAPEMIQIREGHWVSCHRRGEKDAHADIA
jgi:oligopeptide/dipeptide ABC transporter ATP-binding protein